MKPKIIKINCDKINDYLFTTLIIFGIVLWAGVTIGSIYTEYWVATHYTEMHDWFLYGFVLALLTIGNAYNLYHVIRTVYAEQNLIKFQCTSESDNK